jgi:predicted acyl esterase/NAD(P)-dependent dehydrogenase (short-subunit alcohol dehydrogenase family)
MPKTFIITGGNTGLGFQCASALSVDRGDVVVLACRDVTTAEHAADKLRQAGGHVEVLPLDLAEQASIHSFVDKFRAQVFPPLAGLVCNAGGQSVTAPTRNAEGFEKTFAVNHLGHYLLARLMLPDLAPGARITFVASNVHDPKQKTGMPAPRYENAEVLAHDFEPGAAAGKRRYTTSKLCNIYTTYELARRLAASTDQRLQSIRVNAFDPGMMPGTGLAQTYSPVVRFAWHYVLPALALFQRNVNTPAKSGSRLAQLAAGSEGNATGKYFSDGHETRSSDASFDNAKALELWNSSADMTHLPHDLARETSAPRMVSYPSSWNVVFSPADPVPANYAFGPQTKILKKGSVFPPAARPLPCEIEWDRDVPVKLRDGVTIYTDILRPVGGGKVPAIVAWSPYGKTIPQKDVQSGVDPANVTGMSKSEGPDAGFWVSHGYAVINPDARGAGRSQGDIHAWGSVDGQDGHDVIEWIAQQPWSTGKVALHGTSWLAMAQWFIAQTKPPHLAAIAPWNGTSDIYRQNMMFGGIPNVEFLAGVFDHLAGPARVERPDLMAQDHRLMDDYWQDKAARLESITIPTYTVTDVVTDLHRMGTFEGYRRLGSKHKWLRVNNRQEWTDQYDDTNEADLLKFFDHFLRGADNGWLNTPKVRMAVLDPGGEDRLNVPYTSWPLQETHYELLYLGHDQHLQLTPTATEFQVHYPATTGQSVFTFRFTTDTQLTGYLKAHIWVEAKDANEADLFVLVEKLDKDGKLLVPDETSARQYFPIPPAGTHGRLRASLRKLDPALSTDFMPIQSFDQPQMLHPGEIVALDIAIMPASEIFHAGEQLRLTIAGHEFTAPPGPPPTGMLAFMPKLPPLPTKNAGVHVIHGGGDHQSFLQIPVIPIM